jgi:hypothetical protein
MAMVRYAAAAGILALSVHAATACDDYMDEMAVAEARQAVTQAQAPVPTKAPGPLSAAPAPAETPPATGVASAVAKLAQAGAR